MGTSDSAITRAMTLRFTPIPGAPFGVEVNGIEWRRPDAETVRLLTMALRRHLLLALRGQSSPSEEELNEFMRGFGRLVLETEDGRYHYQQHLKREGPMSDLARSNMQNLTRAADNTGSTYISPGDAGAVELIWHTDQGHKPQLKILSVLEMIECESEVVPTRFRDMYTAYEMLPPELRGPLEHRQLAFYDPRLPGPAEMPRLCDSMHPLFIPHPQSGRRALYTNESVDRIVGLDRGESDRLLSVLKAHTEQNAPLYRHRWREGDMVVWDNIGLQHRRDALPPKQRRRLRQYGGVAG